MTEPFKNPPQRPYKGTGGVSSGWGLLALLALAVARYGGRLLELIAG